MSPRLMEHIFEPFFTTKEVGQGTGMGLSVVHGITKKCGAVIGVESKEAKGTTFSIFFPRIQAEDTQTAGSPTAPTGDKHFILLVDDEDVMVDVMKQTLERLGYRVIGQTSSPEALKAFEAEPDKFDLVITDLIMPRKDGMETIIELKRDYLDAKIIAISGGSRAVDPRDYLHYTTQFGVLHTLTKPFTPQEMLEDVRAELQEQVETTTG